MITHELVIGYPHGSKRSGLLIAIAGPIFDRTRWKRLGPGVTSGSRQGDKVSQVGAPEVLDTIRQQHNALRTQRVHRALVVSDEHDRPAVAPQGRQDLGAAARI